MQFQLSDEQKQIQTTMREFAAREIGPHVMTWDEGQHFPIELIPKMAGLGLMGIIFPEAYGGAGLGQVEYALIIEEIARVDPAVALSLAAHNGLCANHIYRAGTESQRKKYLTPLARGEKLGAWALTEPSSGSDAGAMRTTAIMKDGQWALNGVKNFTTHGTTADLYVLFAVTDRSSEKHRVSAFIAERGTPGLSFGKKENKLGMRASDTASVIMEDCILPGENLLGEVNRGFLDALGVLDGGRVAIAAISVGIAQGAFEAALNYAQERRAFGQEISSFQAIRWKFADMATQIDAARLLTRRAAELRTAGARMTKEASMAKLYASEMAVRVAEEAIQIFGGYGYVKDYPVEKYWRDSKLLTIGEGTSEVQRMIIAREVLREIHPA